MNTQRILPFLALLLIPGTALAQGPLTPPAAPIPTMKTLEQVEPRKPIDATNTPGDATSVFKITAPGSYYLTGNLAGVGGKNGIAVTATNVTIDLHGFALNGVSGSLDGVHMESGTSKLTLRNGTITGWGGDGVDEVDADAQGGIYENIHAAGNGGDGLRLDASCVITACKLDDNSVYGVSVDGRATIKDCTASDNGAGGFYFGAGSILDSVASANSGTGIESFAEPVLIKNCVAFDNEDAGIQSGGGGKITDCISRQNSFAGIDAGYYTTVTNCTVKNNTLGIFAGGSCRIVGNMAEGSGGDGISIYDDRNVIEGNQILNGGTGIKVAVNANNNLIIKNTVGSNTTNYDISADNRFGPIVDISAAGTPAVNGSTALDSTTTAHPWANFSY